jgi:GNAT superfamily N-acetyltransferase
MGAGGEGSPLERRLQRYLRNQALGRAGSEVVGPFLASFDAASTNPYRNYAIPDDGADPGDDAIDALLDAYRRRGRTPRVEYFPGAAPLVEAALVRAGFVIDARPSVMTCTSAPAGPTTAPDGIEVVAVASVDDRRGAVQAAHLAFGEGRPQPSDYQRLASMLEAGGAAVIAREKGGGAVLGAAQYPAARDGVTEISGVAVVPTHRRRGIAGALCALLVAQAIASGVSLCWLSPGGPEAERVYARVGFTVVSQALHMHHP